MTELSKYIGPDMDLPGQGEGVYEAEIGLVLLFDDVASTASFMLLLLPHLMLLLVRLAYLNTVLTVTPANIDCGMCAVFRLSSHPSPQVPVRPVQAHQQALRAGGTRAALGRGHAVPEGPGLRRGLLRQGPAGGQGPVPRRQAMRDHRLQLRTTSPCTPIRAVYLPSTCA